MLGIGIDEKTALIVNGHAGRVAGANAVSFYNFNKCSTEESAFVILQSGESYDLKIRRKIK
jgi:cyanophycinase-like exopeptidase